MDRSSDSLSPTHESDNASVQSSGSSRGGDAGALKAVKQPRRNKKRYRANFFPRIIKRDLRRLYPKMLSNAINSSDPQLLSAFFATFARPDCLFTPCDSYPTAAVVNPIRGKVPSSEPNSPTFADLRTFLLTFAVQCDLMPDITFDIRSARIHQYRRESEHKNNPLFVSEVVCDIVFSGTIVYEYDLNTVSMEGHQVELFLRNKAKHQPVASPPEDDQQLVPALVPPSIAQRKRRILDRYITLRSEGVTRLIVDNDNRISGMFCVA